MTEYYLLDDLGETLATFLGEVLSPGLVSSVDKIGLGDLDKPGPEVRIFVFAVQEQPEMRNLPPTVAPAGGDYIVKPAPNYLMVDFLIVPYMDGVPDNLKVATRVLQAFYDQPVIRGHYLRGGLAGTDAELRVLLHPISLDDLTKLWSSFPETKFKFSLCYRVYNVPLESTREEAEVAVRSTDDRYGEAAEKEDES